ncbi:MAG: flavin reductase [Herminiimonas sp.]|nr:flavin reductase [Herminiimonas sp.]
MIDKQTFREAMSRLAAAVNVITSNGPGGLCGCTASAVCSVSDEPPILLVCINRSSRNNAVLKENQQLCVNVLRADQEALALQFSRSGTDVAERFAGTGWTEPQEDHAVDGAPGSPMLDDALVSLDCRITGSAEVGSHTVFYCTVEDTRFGAPGPGLVYFERAFHAVPASDSSDDQK